MLLRTARALHADTSVKRLESIGKDTTCCTSIMAPTHRYLVTGRYRDNQ